MRSRIAFLIVTLFISAASAEPYRHTQLIFPLQGKHVHGSSLVELPNGDILACWFYGSGERSADDVLIQGSRLKAGAKEWSPVFVMADTPQFPDCNPTLFLDKNGKLWMFWITVRANRWERSILSYRTSTDFLGDGPPNWNWQGFILLKPGPEFVQSLKDGFQALDPREGLWGEYARPYTRLVIEAAEDAVKRQEGWMTRNHPVTLANGRIVLPLYHDGFNLALCALSDDGGETWAASKPIVGLAGIQPTVIQKNDGTLVAYLRDSGDPPGRVLMSTSADNGETWTPAVDTDIPNPSSSLEVIKLHNGLWAMVHNDSERNRGTARVALSEDEGKTWKWSRHLGTTESYAYFSMLQAKDGLIHISYSYSPGGDKGKSIRHEVINVEWVKEGD
ncbi:MAG TPA: sialidase family protein [bacterium]|mgnify:CR=1 FL=1|nr:sialidase family protein [bacterium]HQO35135.1 sialidase family protein [bacterium]HQQ00687.1 sialidase family protein [bacterium]